MGSSLSKSESVGKQCTFCRKTRHTLEECEKFDNLSNGKRWLFIRQKKLCFGCLRSKHRYENCERRQVCHIDGCQEYHHKLLHRKADTKSALNRDARKVEPEVVLSTKSETKSNQILFRSLPVMLYNPNNGRKIAAWAFLDEGSFPTMILDSVASELELDGEQDALCITWTDNSVRKEEHSRRVQLMLSGVNQPRKFVMKNVRTVSEMNLPTPTSRTKLIERYAHLRDLKITDIPINRPVILIGLEHAKLGLMYEIREGKWDEPIATHTRLGWVIHGKQDEGSISYVCHICECGNNNEFEKMIQDFSSTESFGVKNVDKLLEGKDTIRAKHMLETTTKKLDNSYETGLLWRQDHIKLPNSKDVAEKRLICFECFERRLDRNEELKSAVRSKISEHIEKGYMVEIQEHEFLAERHWYLPIFAVINPNKPSKPRLVFDAAARSKGISLNDLLLKGPEMLSSLFGIILRFRLRRFAVSADIAEMFHRIRIIEKDQLCQLVLWRDCYRDEPMKTYKMTRMTFGATCSPCSAHYVKDEHAKKFFDIYPRAVEAIIRNHYVDNLLDCFDSEDEILEVARQIQMIHNEANFFIRDWMSNSKLVIKAMNGQVNDDNLEIDLNVVNETNTTERILGMFWKVEEDVFVFKTNMAKINPQIVKRIRPPTKREVLRVVMSQFDPLGVLAPLIIHAKILMQEIWSSKIDWDDEIPPYLIDKWNDWLEALDNVIHLRVRRWYFCYSLTSQCKLALHIFTDSSEEAFACVAFIVLHHDEEINVSFVAAKSRVAPTPPKCLSIPRLELQAAVLATRLKNSIVSEISIELDDIIFWTDSKTVLGWIRSTKRKYSTFVSHRISEILDSTMIIQWRWLPSGENVADEATRLTETPCISNRWLNGPDFLYRGRNFWPEEKEKVESTDEERTKVVEVHHVQVQNILIDIKRFSKWERLVRCVAFVKRFIYVMRARCMNRKSGRQFVTAKMPISELTKLIPFLNGEEIDQAEKTLFRIVQREDYDTEIKMMEAGRNISKKSKIFNLNPILDNEGILRLSGRLESAPAIIDNIIRQPIILSREHRITYLLIDAMHRKFHHLNKEYVVNEIRQFIWIPKIRVEVNRVVRNCSYCKWRLAQPRAPKMSALPDARLSPFQPAFSYTGVDFFGPIEITIGRRHEKRWGVLFVCLTMRAIHIEISATLDTSSAIMCLRNFECRRGPPIELFSDNGTNLRAAEKELKKVVSEIDFERLQNESIIPLPNETRPKWNFIPPGAPHFGGSWERMIQTVKRSLYIVLKEKFPREETLRNALIEIENIVNSRPLYYTPNDVDNQQSITPNHLLKGSKRQMVPLPGNYDCRKQWRVSQALATEFWNRWLREYLPTISRRPKWNSDIDSVQLGDLVLIVDENLQRGEWKKGIISKIYPSKDGKIRSAEVKTSHGTYTRPVAKLAIVDLRNNVSY